MQYIIVDQTHVITGTYRVIALLRLYLYYTTTTTITNYCIRYVYNMRIVVYMYTV